MFVGAHDDQVGVLFSCLRQNYLADIFVFGDHMLRLGRNAVPGQMFGDARTRNAAERTELVIMKKMEFQMK